MKVKALVIPADPHGGPVRVEEIEDDANGIRAIIDGDIRTITPVDLIAVPWHAYIDEEGKLKGLAFNEWASLLAYRLGWFSEDLIFGPAVFLGNPVATQFEADVPKRVIAEFLEMVEKGDH